MTHRPSRLLAALPLALALISAGVAPAWAQFKVAPSALAIPEAQNYVKNGSPYLAYGQYRQCAAVAERATGGCGGRIHIDPRTFPNNSVIVWTTPFRQTATSKPWAYPAISRGRPSGGTPNVVDPLRKVSEVRSLKLSLDADLKMSGDASVLSDTFLYRDKTLKQMAAEIGVFAYAGPAAKAFMARSEPIRGGFYKDSQGRTWIARRSRTYNMFALESGDALKSDIDLKGFLDFLMGDGSISGDLIYPGTAIGVEPAQGTGALRINRFDVGPG
jgi:hypothetical protein